MRGRNETRSLNLEEQTKKYARMEMPVGDTAGSVRRTTGMGTYHNHYFFILQLYIGSL